jgi:hypothetical protein
MGPFWKTALEIVLTWLGQQLQFWMTGTTTDRGMHSRLILMTVAKATSATKHQQTL